MLPCSTSKLNSVKIYSNLDDAKIIGRNVDFYINHSSLSLEVIKVISCIQIRAYLTTNINVTSNMVGSSIWWYRRQQKSRRIAKKGPKLPFVVPQLSCGVEKKPHNDGYKVLGGKIHNLTMDQ